MKTEKTERVRGHGKKIDFLDVSGKVRHHRVDLYFDRDNGKFFAQLEGADFTTVDLAELKKQLRDAAIALDDVTFKWYIQANVIQYGAPYHGIPSGDVWKRIDGFSLDLKVLAVSDDKPGLGRLTKRVEEQNGKLMDLNYSPSRFFERIDDPALIPYTPERWAALKAIQSGVRKLYRRLLEMLGGDAAATAALLDAFKPSQLSLPAGKSEDDA